MSTGRVRLDDAQVAAIASFHFGISRPPEVPRGDELEDAQGVLVATYVGGELDVTEIPRWEAPAALAERLAARGWDRPAAWIGVPPDDVGSLPDRLLVLIPAAQWTADAASLSAAASAWRSVGAGGRDIVVVPVPVTAEEAAADPGAVALAYGATLAGCRMADGAARTGGRVVFCTGLSGAGKSTIAARVVHRLVEAGVAVTLLDGDEVRHHLSAGLGFSREDRDTNVRRIGWVAAQIAKHGGIAVCAPIAPYATVRADVRREVESQAGSGSFVLVHVATSLEDCEQRDRKGLYAKARRGEIPAFTGVSDPYEAPTDAEVTVETRGRTVDECARQVLDHVLDG